MRFEFEIAAELFTPDMILDDPNDSLKTFHELRRLETIIHREMKRVKQQIIESMAGEGNIGHFFRRALPLRITTDDISLVPPGFLCLKTNDSLVRTASKKGMIIPGVTVTDAGYCVVMSAGAMFDLKLQPMKEFEGGDEC